MESAIVGSEGEAVADVAWIRFQEFVRRPSDRLGCGTVSAMSSVIAMAKTKRDSLISLSSCMTLISSERAGNGLR